MRTPLMVKVGSRHDQQNESSQNDCRGEYHEVGESVVRPAIALPSHGKRNLIIFVCRFAARISKFARQANVVRRRHKFLCITWNYGPKVFWLRQLPAPP